MAEFGNACKAGTNIMPTSGDPETNSQNASENGGPLTPDDMTSASFHSPSCGSQRAVSDRRAATRRANSRGAKYPKLLCGRSSFYSSLQAAIFSLASKKFPNQ